MSEGAKDDMPPGTGEGTSEGSTVRASSRSVRLAYRGLGIAMLSLGAAGVVLPGLPATPFVLLAVWALGKGDPQLARRVEAHPRFGPMVTNWRQRRAVPTRAKIAAVLSMSASLVILWATGAGPLVLGAVAAILTCVAAYLVTRPAF